MAAVVRVKRRRCDDPAEALYLSCVSKRVKRETSSDETNEEVTSIWRLAATVPTKDEPVYSRIQHALSKEQLQREFKQHAVDIRARMRSEKRDSMQAGRYKVVSRHRELESCDSQQEASENGDAVASVSASADRTESKATVATPVSDDKTAGALKDSASGGSGGAGDGGSDSTVTGERAGAGEEGRAPGSADSQGRAASRVGNLWIYDVEVEPQEAASGSTQQRPQVSARAQAVNPHEQLSDIMCNGVRMMATNEGANEDYVYDLYYATQRMNADPVMDPLRIEAFFDLFETRSLPQEDDVVSDEDSDDSNAEDNWRNDYPEEEDLEDSGEEDFEGNRICRTHRAGYDPEDADPDYSGLPQSMVDQLFIDGSSYGGGGRAKPVQHYFDCESDEEEEEEDDEEDNRQGNSDYEEEEIDFCD